MLSWLISPTSAQTESHDILSKHFDRIPWNMILEILIKNLKCIIGIHNCPVIFEYFYAILTHVNSYFWTVFGIKPFLLN